MEFNLINQVIITNYHMFILIFHNLFINKLAMFIYFIIFRLIHVAIKEPTFLKMIILKRIKIFKIIFLDNIYHYVNVS